jgi:putative transposase
MLKAYKYRIYPNKEQRLYLAKTFGCVRFVYNKMLADRIKAYEENKDLEIKKIKYPTPAQYKTEFKWLKEVDSLALANTYLILNKTYSNFFRDKQIGFPKFKTKKSNYHSFTTYNQKGTVSIKDNKIKIPKLKSMIKLKYHREINGLIKSCTISQTPTGKYFASVLVDEEILQMDKCDNKIGIDVGLKEFAITSNGEFFHNPKWFRKSENKLAKNQKLLASKKKGSVNRYKQRIKVAKIHEKINNQRNDFLHKVSKKIISENQVIVIEDLRVKNMLKNKKLAKAISEVSWAKFRSMLEYKAKWYGRELIIASSNYASSQLCSNCGNKSSQTKDLKCRIYECPICGLTIDRDINASLNLFKLACDS